MGEELRDKARAQRQQERFVEGIQRVYIGRPRPKKAPRPNAEPPSVCGPTAAARRDGGREGDDCARPLLILKPPARFYAGRQVSDMVPYR